MNRILLFLGGMLTFALATFKIAMPYLFGWREAMGSSAASMWATLSAENLGIALLLLFFSHMSIFQWSNLLTTSLGKADLLSMSSLWIFRTIAEIVLFKIGVDGACWRLMREMPKGLLARKGTYKPAVTRSLITLARMRRMLGEIVQATE